jgi:hypothetical protein
MVSFMPWRGVHAWLRAWHRLGGTRRGLDDHGLDRRSGLLGGRLLGCRLGAGSTGCRLGCRGLLGGRLLRCGLGRAAALGLPAFLAARLLGGHFGGLGLGGTDLHAHRLLAPDFFQAVVLADGRLHDVHHRPQSTMIHSPFSRLPGGARETGFLTASRTLEARALVWRLEVPEATITRSNSGDSARC